MVQTCLQLVNALDTGRAGTIKTVRNSYDFSIGKDLQPKHAWGSPYCFDQQEVFFRSLCSGVRKHVSVGWKMQGLLCFGGIRTWRKRSVLSIKRLCKTALQCITLARSPQLDEVPGISVWLLGQMPMCSILYSYCLSFLSSTRRRLPLYFLFGWCLTVLFPKWYLEIVWECVGLRGCQAQSSTRWSQSGAREYSWHYWVH